MVEWKKLGEVCISLNKGTLKQGELIENGKYPVINSGVSLYGRYNEYNNEGNAFTIASRGEYAGFINYSSERFWAGGLCYPYRSNEERLYLTKYLYICLKNYERKIMKTLVSRGSIPAINKTDVDNILIPIPSLEEQERIVGILDTFTASIDNIKAQIEQRRKQYEHYRNTLLTFNKDDDSVEWKTLGEISEIKGEYGLSAPSKPFNGVRYIRITDITDNGKLNKDKVSADCTDEVRETLKEGDILFARTGATVGKTLLYLNGYGKCLYAGYLIKYRINTKTASCKYVFHYTHTYQYLNWIKSNLVEGAQPNINAQKYNALNIPIPSLARQQEIVSILDTFEASITNLEAQLEQRQKQYEYYREKLLTF